MIIDKILDFLFNKYKQKFVEKIKKNFQEDTQAFEQYLASLYFENQKYYTDLFIKDFVGYIPKDITEPVFKIFQENSEQIERWVLWHSWNINRKAINDPSKILLYNGMMIYLKVIYTIAIANKSSKQKINTHRPQKVETPWIETALQGVQEFNSIIDTIYADNKTNSSAKIKDSKIAKIGNTENIKDED